MLPRRLVCFLLLVPATSCEDRTPSPPTAPPQAAPADAAPPPIDDPGHARMIALLDSIASEAGQEHPYLGRAEARRAEAALATVDTAATRERLALLERAANARLRLGDERQAIDHFELLLALTRREAPDSVATARASYALGVAYLRLGETENCCLQSTPESCILPIREGGLHRRTRGSREAMRCFREVLESPGITAELRDAASWLLNVAAMTLGTYPADVPPEHRVPPKAFSARGEFPRFANIAARVGLDTVSLSGGAAVEDFDGDGDLDLLVSTWDPRGPMRLFRNEGKDRFVESSAATGLNGIRGGLNLVPGDYDGDGDTDVIVLRGAWLGTEGRHPNSLLQNDGAGRFLDVSFAAGLADEHYPTQTAAWSDYDRDGDLDLFIGNEWDESLRAPSQLFRNRGNGTFDDVAEAAGVENRRYAKGVSWGDVDEDGWPDLYVSNLDGPNRLYRNSPEGKFEDIASRVSVTLPSRSFPTWFWDFDNDGHLDLFVGSYGVDVAAVGAHFLGRPAKYERSRLYKGDGRGGFVDVAEEAGLAYPALTMGANYGDLDGDGLLDIYLGTGDPEYESLMPNVMFLNRGQHGFANVALSGGFAHLQKGHAVAFADFDRDGDLDVFQQMGGAYPGDRFGDALYENPGSANDWIRLRLRGTHGHPSALGARIRIQAHGGGRQRSVYRHVTTGGSFGANPLEQTIGLGNIEAISYAEVRWPKSGTLERFEGLRTGGSYELIEGRGVADAKEKDESEEQQ